MSALKFFLFSLALWLPMNTIFSQNLFINEFLASNSTVITDEFGGFDDWVEIYNAEPFPVDIGGMYVTDDLSAPTKWQIPSTDPTKTTIPAGGYLILWFDGEPAQGVLHVDPKLGAGGEDIGLFAANGVQIDALTFGPQTSNISYGRLPDGGAILQFFNAPTPGGTNSASPGGNLAEAPTASVGGGFYNSPFNVALSSTTANATIYYTLDGSDPTNASTLYTGPLFLGQTTTLRAKAYATGALPSNTATFTYLFENAHTFPVVALSFNDADFFDPATGIYPNYEENWERPLHVELYETNGALVLNQEANVEIQGTGSATLPQKSLRVEALASGGSGFFEYPIFPDQPFDKYERFVMRNSGQDWNITMFRDAMVTSLSSDLADVGNIIQSPKLFQQAYRPGVVYLNGEYWGIHNLREHMKSEYVEQHFGLTENEIDLLDNDDVEDGTADNWNALTNFLLTNDFTNDANMAQLGQMVDLPNFLDYNVFNIIIDNSDWPGNNYRRWRDKNNGQWRFMTFDLDFTFGLFNFVPGGPTWNTGDASANALERSLDDTQTGWPNPQWKTLYFRKTIENENFRRDYINRTADFLNVLFDPARVNERIGEFEALYTPEIQRHFDRWNMGFNPFADNVALLRQFANERPQYVRQHVVDAFPEVAGTATITLQTVPAGAGNIEFSTLNLTAGQLPWAGEYFTGIDIPVKVIPAPGFVFDGWSDPNLGNALNTNVNLSGDKVLTAFFSPINNQVQNVVINEINYNSPDTPNSDDWLELYNPNNQTVDMSGWTLEDSDGGVYLIPNGTFLPPNDYLVLVEKAITFSSVFPTTAHLGDFGTGLTSFKLNNSNELITLKNASQVVIDTVHYNDGGPWPVEPDGTGPTLQLINPTLDNALAQSWISQTPTPGAVNTITLQPQTINFFPIPDKFINDQPFAISATATSGLPVTFTLLSGPVTLNGNIVTLNGTVGLVFIQATQPGNNFWEAAPPVTRAFRVNEPPASVEYCGAMGEQPWLEWIGRVKFAGIDNVSAKTEYSDFTNLTANVGPGDLVGMVVVPKFSWQSFDEHIRAWIDFNQDFDFDDPGEMVLEANGAGPASTNVLIPLSAASGPTRMRVAMQRGQYASPCDTFAIGEVEDYTVNIGTSTLLSQTIDFQPVLDQTVGAAPFSLSATATSGLPVSFAVISGPATTSGNVVTLAGTTGTVTIRATQPGNAQWQAAASVERSFDVTDGPPPPGTYCTSSGEQPWLEWIGRVEFGNIDHSSFKEQYGDFTNISTSAGLGETLALQVTPTFSWQVYEEYFRAWIDFNQDFDFDDPGEMVLEAIGTGPVSADVLIPQSAVQGPARMRVSMQRGQFPAACGDFPIGEVQDYTVTISNSFQPDDGPAKNLHLSIAPNPTNYDLNASFKLMQGGETKLTIIHATGVEVFSENRFFDSGEHRISLDISNLMSGPYMLFLQPEKQKAAVGRFVKMEE